jgi:3-deoxy-D-arabino-heptulosonate 7-phosphate (DAHP) synthase
MMIVMKPMATEEEVEAVCERVHAVGARAHVIYGDRNMQNYTLLSEIGRARRPALILMAIPVLKEMTHLPVIVDPSHAAGRRDLVAPMSLAAAAAGADGLIVEVHPNPDEAICDAAQQLVADEFPEYLDRVRAAAAVAGKALWEETVASGR